MSNYEKGSQPTNATRFHEVYNRYHDVMNQKAMVQAEVMEAYAKVLRAVAKHGSHVAEAAMVKSSVKAMMKNDAHGIDGEIPQCLLDFAGAEEEWTKAPVYGTQRQEVIEALRSSQFPEDCFEDERELDCRAALDAFGTMKEWNAVDVMLGADSTVETILAEVKSVAIHAVFGRPLKWFNASNKAVALVALAEKWGDLENGASRDVICKFFNGILGDEILVATDSQMTMLGVAYRALFKEEVGKRQLADYLGMGRLIAKYPMLARYKATKVMFSTAMKHYKAIEEDWHQRGVPSAFAKQ